jgi:hypothetical protein
MIRDAENKKRVVTLRRAVEPPALMAPNELSGCRRTGFPDDSEKSERSFIVNLATHPFQKLVKDALGKEKDKINVKSHKC